MFDVCLFYCRSLLFKGTKSNLLTEHGDIMAQKHWTFKPENLSLNPMLPILSSCSGIDRYSLYDIT